MGKLIFRFDDIHPFMDINVLRDIVSISKICPSSIMVCVIPENKDITINATKYPISNFWEIILDLQKNGAIIGLHGFNHILRKTNRSILNVSRKSEFTGLSFKKQRKLIYEGLNYLKLRGLNPQFFAAPAHGFDKNTLRVLKDLEFINISDGYYPDVCIKNGLNWIPLKTWKPNTRFLGGVNTVCIHLNKNNSQKIKNGISDIVKMKKNIGFSDLIASSREIRFSDEIIHFIYKIAIKVLLIKRLIIRILKINQKKI